MRHGWAIFTGQKPTASRSLDLDSVKRGQMVFINHCAGCHGSDGKGDGEIAKQFKIQPTNLRNLSKEKSNHYLVVQISNGKGNMPQWQDLLTTKQTWDVTSYIQSLNSAEKKEKK